MPFSIDQRFELDAELNNLISLPDVVVAVAVLTFVRIKVNQEFSLTHADDYTARFDTT
jgi:hypothetical protein